MENESFINWINQELDKREWSQADLARIAHLSPGGISHILTGTRKPGIDVCEKIAKAFKIPADEVFRIANLLPPKPKTDPITEDFLFTLQFLTDEDRQELLELAKFKVERQERQQREKKWGNSKTIPQAE
jgi:transcriptional regulator with XRE-family HTH domain